MKWARGIEDMQMNKHVYNKYKIACEACDLEDIKIQFDAWCVGCLDGCCF